MSLKASALVYAIVIGLIIALTSSSLILFSYFSSIHYEDYSDKERVIRNARSGINLLLAQTTETSLAKEQRIDLFGNGMDSVILSAKTWGALEVLTSTAVSAHNRFSMSAFAGDNFSDDSTMAFYLADMDKPLSLCGETVLRGTCFLPKAGLKRAYIEGQNFIGNKMTDGSVKDSERKTPAVNKPLIDNIRLLFKRIPEKDTVVSLEEAVLPDTMKRSFTDSTVVFYSNAVIRINDQRLEGNIQVISTKKVLVSPNAILENIIIAAPEIEVEEGFTGTLQLFATDSITIGTKCNFNFPSVIGLIPNEYSGNSPAIILKEKTALKGVLFAWSEKPDPQKLSRIVLQKETIINGHVYSGELLDLQGTVYGSVICQKLILSTPSAVYENHLLNAVIDRPKLSKYFVGINLLARESHKKVVRWMY